MRPKEKWTKERKEKIERPKRVYKTRKSKTNSAAETQSANTDGQASTMTADESSPVNPAEENVEEDLEQSQPLPAQTRPRAASLQPGSTSKSNDSMSNAAATAALQRAIQSSPARFLGTQHSPIDIDELTPKPIRRLLFPSPRAAGQTKALQDRSPNASDRTAPTHDNPTASPAADQADKENQPPPDHDDLAHFFDGPLALDRPATPTPAGTARSPTTTDPFKTPDKLITPSRTALTPADIFSSAAKALLLPPLLPPRTPTQGHLADGTRAALGEMTPFTAHLNQLLSEANAVLSPTATLDFGALPPLPVEGVGEGGSSPGLGMGLGMGEGLGEGGFFALYEDPVDFAALMEGVGG